MQLNRLKDEDVCRANCSVSNHNIDVDDHETLGETNAATITENNGSKSTTGSDTVDVDVPMECLCNVVVSRVVCDAASNTDVRGFQREVATDTDDLNGPNHIIVDVNSNHVVPNTDVDHHDKSNATEENDIRSGKDIATNTETVGSTSESATDTDDLKLPIDCFRNNILPQAVCDAGSNTNILEFQCEVATDTDDLNELSQNIVAVLPSHTVPSTVIDRHDKRNTTENQILRSVADAASNTEFVKCRCETASDSGESMNPIQENLIDVNSQSELPIYVYNAMRKLQIQEQKCSDMLLQTIEKLIPHMNKQ